MKKLIILVAILMLLFCVGGGENAPSNSPVNSDVSIPDSVGGVDEPFDTPIMGLD